MATTLALDSASMNPDFGAIAASLQGGMFSGFSQAQSHMNLQRTFAEMQSVDVGHSISTALGADAQMVPGYMVGSTSQMAQTITAGAQSMGSGFAGLSIGNSFTPAANTFGQIGDIRAPSLSVADLRSESLGGMVDKLVDGGSMLDPSMMTQASFLMKDLASEGKATLLGGITEARSSFMAGITDAARAMRPASHAMAA